MINIVPTLTVMETQAEYQLMIDNYIEAGSSTFRCNATRFSNDIYCQSITTLQDLFIQRKNKPFDLLLDLPIPRNKVRLFYPGNEKQVCLNESNTIIIRDIRNMDVSVGRFDGMNLYTKLNLLAAKEGDTVILGDGDIELTVISIEDQNLICLCNTTNTIGIGKSIYTSAFSPDAADESTVSVSVDLVKSLQPKWVALSFVECANDVLTMRKKFASVGCCPRVLSKIENLAGVDNLENIATNSDGIMIARGDLALSIGFTNLYAMQTKILRYCLSKGKFVYVASGILETLVTNRFPSRAEVCDVASLIEDGIQNIILSGPLCRYNQFRTAVQCIKDISIVSTRK
jgi:pyruvate kinase